VITVDEIMSTDLVTLGETDPLDSAARLMNERGIRHIPVVDNNGQLKGLITHRDVLASTGPDTPEASTVRIGDVMTKNVRTVDERASLRRAAIFLQKHKYGCMPVVTDGVLKGIITDSDFVSVAINLLEQIEMSEPEED